MVNSEPKTVNITINDEHIKVAEGTSVFNACVQQGIQVPHFCYHPKMSVAGNCRMCLVQIGKNQRPTASCTVPVAEGMEIHTNTEMVDQARQGVMELLLINHPLDCPICDQGGCCDLQDFAIKYGSGRSRFNHDKRQVDEKYLGPLVKTVMNRCIHCTRCIRFMDEIAGTSELVAVQRGEHMEITNAPDAPLRSEVSGNIIDICPVGALTDKPFAFKGRSWEWQQTESIDVMDALGSNITVHSRDNKEVVHILPRKNEDINEDWLSDRGRFSYDGLKFQRLDTPYIRKDGRLQPCGWDEALGAVAKAMLLVEGPQMAALAGDLADVESMFVLKQLLASLNCYNVDCRQDAIYMPFNNRSYYIMNSGIKGIESADCVLLVGVNPRQEAALLNLRLRKMHVNSGVRFGFIGARNVGGGKAAEGPDLTYDYDYIGDSPADILRLLRDSGNPHKFADCLKHAKRPAIILGHGVFARDDAGEILKAVEKLLSTYAFIQDDWNGYNVLHAHASVVGGIDVGFVPSQISVGDGNVAAEGDSNNIKYSLNTREIVQGCLGGDVKFLYLLGFDNFDKVLPSVCDKKDINKNDLGDTFVVYQGHHGDYGAGLADVVLPGCAYTEKTATYVNTEGRVQCAFQAVSPLGHGNDDVVSAGAKADWKIITALSHKISGYVSSEVGHSDDNLKKFKPLPYIEQEDVWQAFKKNVWDKNKMKSGQRPLSGGCYNLASGDSSGGQFLNKPFVNLLDNYYMTNIISRHSPTMASCIQEIIQKQKPKGWKQAVYG